MNNYERALELWRHKKPQTDAELAEALNGHSIAFAYHSGKIENEKITYHDTREVFEHDGVTSYTGDLRTLFEIRNAKEANELFLLAFRDRRPLDEALIREFQLQLTHGTYDSRRWQLGAPRRVQAPRLCDGQGGSGRRPGGCGGGNGGAAGGSEGH